jgi:hypothetical protein
MVRPLALLITLAALPLHAQLVHYAPGQFRYDVVNVIKRSDVRGDTRQDYTITATQTMALLLTPRGTDSLRMRITLEANALKSDLPIQLPHVERMNGTVVEGVMTSAGRVLHFTHHSPDSSSLEVSALADNMSRFLLWVTPGATVGKPVTDTTSSRETDGGTDVTERTVTTTTIVGDTVYAGQKAWRIRRDTEVQVSGVLMQQGQSLQESGGGTGTGMFYVTESGVYLGSKTQSATTTALKLPDGSTITSALDANSSVTLVK